MNIQEKLENKKQKLQKIKNVLQEGIYSQVKYLEYSEKEIKLENDIKELENIIEKEEKKMRKIWIDMGNGWKKRINKPEK